jgi:uncharacterized protein
MKETFIGRKQELSFLEQKYTENGGQLIFVYGRRRVGKTETLTRFCSNKKSVLFTCTECTDREQLSNFSRSILAAGIPASAYIRTFENWEQALSAVKDIPPDQGKKSLLIIDEFPYMVKGNTSISSILQKLWDTELKNQNIMIILCGSSMSFMEKEILAEKNPLYGRTTGILRMEQLPISDAIQFVPDYSVYEKTAVYSILGGIPYYLNQMDDSVSLEKNICTKLLQKGSILYSEPEFLLRQELREPSVYNTIIQTIAAGNTKFNDIYNVTLIEKNKLSVYLKNLIDLGIIYKEFPVMTGTAAQANIQRGLYKIKDAYFRFWYAFIFPNISMLEIGDTQGVYSQIIAPRLDEFISLSFEDICIYWLKLQNMNKKLPFRFTHIGRWWNKTDEIDAVACDEQRTNIILAECKFRKSEIDTADVKKHMEKDIHDMKLSASCNVFYYYFSRSGFTKSAEQFAEKNAVTLIPLESLF